MSAAQNFEERATKVLVLGSIYIAGAILGKCHIFWSHRPHGPKLREPQTIGTPETPPAPRALHRDLTSLQIGENDQRWMSLKMPPQKKKRKELWLVALDFRVQPVSAPEEEEKNSTKKTMVGLPCTFWCNLYIKEHLN